MLQFRRKARWILAVVVMVSAAFSFSGVQGAGTPANHGGHVLAGYFPPPGPNVTM
jgi:hypothetical protein